MRALVTPEPPELFHAFGRPLYSPVAGTAGSVHAQASPQLGDGRGNSHATTLAEPSGRGPPPAHIVHSPTRKTHLEAYMSI